MNEIYKPPCNINTYRVSHGGEKPAVGEQEREHIIQEFLSRKREAEANKARVAFDQANKAPWVANDWNYKIRNPGVPSVEGSAVSLQQRDPRPPFAIQPAKNQKEDEYLAKLEAIRRYVAP